MTNDITVALYDNLASSFAAAAASLRALDTIEPIPVPIEPAAYSPRPWQFTPAAFQNAPSSNSQSWRHLGVYSGTSGGSTTTGQALQRAPYTGHTARMMFLGNKGPDQWHKYFSEKRLGYRYWSEPMPYLAITARICDATIRDADGVTRLGNRKPASDRYISPELYEQRMTAFSDGEIEDQVIRTLDIVRDNLADKQTTVVWILSQESEADWYGDAPMTADEAEMYLRRWRVVNNTITAYRTENDLPWYTSMSTGGTSTPRDDKHRIIRDLVFGASGQLAKWSKPDIVSVNCYDHSGTTTGPDNWPAWNNPLSGVRAALDRAIEWDCLFGVGEFMIGRDPNTGAVNADRDNPAFLSLMADLANSCNGFPGVATKRLNLINRQWPQLAEFCLFWSDQKGFTLSEDETPLSLARARVLWGD